MFIGYYDKEKADEPLEFARITRVRSFRRGKAFVRGTFRRLKNDPEMKHELVVNTAGLLGSKAGFMVGGIGGALAGDLAGAAITRRGIRDARAVKKALVQLKNDESAKAMSRLQKIRHLRGLSVQNLKEQSEKYVEDVTGDIAGWAGGNLGGSIIGIPGAGAIPGAMTAKAAQAAFKRVRRRS